MKKSFILITSVLFLTGCSYKIVKIADEKVVSKNAQTVQESQLQSKIDNKEQTTQVNQSQPKKENVDIFKKKQECEKYTSKAEDIASKSRGFKIVVSAPEIFYSPSKESCLMTYTSENLNPDAKFTMYLIVDLLTNEEVYGMGYSQEEKIEMYNQGKDPFKDFQEEIKKLKE